MDNITIRYTDHPKLDDPIFIEGLPGIGNVGKLAAEHLKDELKAVKFAEIFSKYFPPQVLGAATGADLVKEMEKYGVVFSRGEPGAGIVGASGLLLGLGRLYDMQAVCLMGETSGYFVDPKSAQAVLDVLTKYLGLEISFNEL